MGLLTVEEYLAPLLEQPPFAASRPAFGVAIPSCIRDHSKQIGEARHGRGWRGTLSGFSQAVFISYASQDAEAASRICGALRAAGSEVWIERSELRGGDAWDQPIRKQSRTCALFLPVISRNTHDLVEGYFRLEWKLAVDRSHLIAADQPFLLPVVIDNGLMMNACPSGSGKCNGDVSRTECGLRPVPRARPGGLPAGCRATGFPGVLARESVPGLARSTESTVVDGHLVTSRGPGAALDFSLKLVELLCARARAGEVEARLERQAAVAVGS